MIVRVVSLAAALVLGVCGLSACRTNVGNAATIDGHRVSENDVNDYVTGAAQPIKSSSGSSVSPKPFVVQILIDQRLYPKLLRAAKVGSPTKGQLSTLRRQYLAGASPKAKVEQLGVKGYSSRLTSVILDVEVYATLLNQANQQGTDLNTIAAKLKFPVSVNPRYGTWDSKNLALKSTTAAGLPGYLRLQSSSAS